MGEWEMTSQSHADYMRGGDFFSSEQSVTVDSAQTVRIEYVAPNGEVSLKKEVALEANEIVDSMFMSSKALRAFFEKSLQDCRDSGVMWSLHVKATMMKVSHPIVFGHAVSVFYKEAFEKHGDTFAKLGVNPNNGLADIYDKIQALPRTQREQIERDIQACYTARPEMAMG